MRHSPYVTVRWCFNQECVCNTVRGQTLYREKHRTHLATVHCIDLNADVLKVNAGLGSDSSLTIKPSTASAECAFNKLQV